MIPEAIEAKRCKLCGDKIETNYTTLNRIKGEAVEYIIFLCPDCAQEIENDIN